MLIKFNNSLLLLYYQHSTLHEHHFAIKLTSHNLYYHNIFIKYNDFSHSIYFFSFFKFFNLIPHYNPHYHHISFLAFKDMSTIHSYYNSSFHYHNLHPHIIHFQEEIFPSLLFPIAQRTSTFIINSFIHIPTP